LGTTWTECDKKNKKKKTQAVCEKRRNEKEKSLSMRRVAGKMGGGRNEGSDKPRGDLWARRTPQNGLIYRGQTGARQ